MRIHARVGAAIKDVDIVTNTAIEEMMAGGLLQIVAFGAGALSIDNRSAKSDAPEISRN